MLLYNSRKQVVYLTLFFMKIILINFKEIVTNNIPRFSWASPLNIF